MVIERIDRRVTRTRHLLQEALVSLILEQGYASVTVQDVLDRADVGRATFYSHFRDKDALLLSLFASVRDALRGRIMGITEAHVARFGEGIGMMRPLFEHAAQHRRLYRALLSSRDGGLLLGHLHGLLAAPLRAHLNEARTQGSLAPLAPIELVIAGMVSSVMGVLIWWLENDLPYSPEQLDRIVEQLTAPGAAQILGHRPQPLAVHPSLSDERRST
jgi:AcrR family transcriptional regulator